ncbi:MAG TPA: RsmD family RNA methyltransferase, partial [Candidatus Nitrosotenuis sp.]|nr:RsmD family RNA methyltransferase [Candidatus Nitrosotenuis sp.]
IIAHPSPPFGYRNRAQWRVRTLAGQTEIGYFQFASSALCAVEECPILAPRLAEVFEALRQVLRSGGLPAQLVEAEAFVDAAGEQVLLNADFTNFSAPAEVMAKQLRNSLPRIESLLLHDASRDRFELFGPGFIRTQVNENNFCVGHFSFFQSNAHLLDQLARAVTDMPEVQESSCALDLYAGVGVFAVALAKRFGRVVAVESNEGAVRDLEANISLARVSAQAVCADAAKFLSSWPERPELVVLDPPRAGVEPAALSALVTLAPPRVHYVSCDPATLARDLAVLLAGGYRITEVHFFDMFPQTFHIETLVRLAR